MLHNLTQYRGKSEIYFTTDKRYSNYIHDSRKELFTAIKKKDIELVLAMLTAHQFKGSLSKNKKIVLNENIKGKEVETPILYKFEEDRLTLTIKKKKYVLRHYIPIAKLVVEYIQKMKFRNDKDFLTQLLSFIKKAISDRK